jgi:hypothetical protein
MSQTRINREILPTTGGAQNLTDYVARQNNAQTLNSIGVVGNKTVITLPRPSFNTINVSPDTRQLTTINKSFTYLSSVSSTTITNGVEFSEECQIVNGLTFEQALTVKSSCSVIFNNCRFAKSVNMETGAKAIFISAIFYTDGSVQNAGLAADAIINGAIKTSPTAHTNVTVVAQV